jgi:hypothetical protein
MAECARRQPDLNAMGFGHLNPLVQAGAGTIGGRSVVWLSAVACK